MTHKNELEKIVHYPKKYSQYNERTLDDRLYTVEVSDGEYTKIVARTGTVKGKEVLKSMLDHIPPVKIALEIWDWNKDIDRDMQEAKKVMLLEKYLNDSDEMKEPIDNLKEAMTNMYGNTLVNKVFQMANNYPSDDELMKHLVATLKHIINSKKFEELFDKHKFNLSLIDNISPQALGILADYNNWPVFKFNFSGISQGDNKEEKIESQFEEPFVRQYFQHEGIKDESIMSRAVHVVT